MGNFFTIIFIFMWTRSLSFGAITLLQNIVARWHCKQLINTKFHRTKKKIYTWSLSILLKWDFTAITPLFLFDFWWPFRFNSFSQIEKRTKYTFHFRFINLITNWIFGSRNKYVSVTGYTERWCDTEVLIKRREITRHWGSFWGRRNSKRN